MRILCVIQRFYPVIGGSEIFTKKILDYLSTKHDIVVYTTDLNNIKGLWNDSLPKIESDITKPYFITRYPIITPEKIQLDSNSEKLPLAKSFPGPFIPNLWFDLMIQKMNFDLIFATAFPYDHIFPAYIASKKYKIPILIAPLIHTEFPSLYLTAPRMTMLYNSDGIITLTKSEKKLLIDHGINEKKIFVIPPGIDISDNLNENDEFRIQHEIKTEEKIVLFVGSKSNVKGVITLIEAMKLIWKTNNDVILVLIGPTTDEFESYFSKINKKDRKRILNLNEIAEKDKLNAFSTCDVFVLPSKSESFGMVYLEAWLHKKPVIGCNIPSTKDVIDENKNGLLVEFGNIIQLKSAIIDLLNDKLKSKTYGEAGNKKAIGYNCTSLCENFEKLCFSLLKFN